MKLVLIIIVLISIYNEGNKQYYYYSSLRKHIQAYHKSEFRKIQESNEANESILKSRKVGNIFFDRNLQQDSTQSYG